ncbi:DUF6283 family protein [Streptomyces sp. NPDC059928]|uniref:DUF6283 family protein n=1 Tax=unclassified Streptomyces TaxID=2593676 RepID=UPI003658EA45
MPSLHPPAPRPCSSCPYRRDVPSGIWASEEYAKLRRYDAGTADQPPSVFQCHQKDAYSDGSRICSGWAGCHDAGGLLALRFALLTGTIDVETHRATTAYVSPIPLFCSGHEAAAHGEAGVDAPAEEAHLLIKKITRTRQHLTE